MKRQIQRDLAFDRKTKIQIPLGIKMTSMADKIMNMMLKKPS
jgi:hypothetical protein